MDMIVTDEARRSAAIRALHRANVNTGEHLIDFADSVLVGIDELDIDDLDDYSGQVTEVFDAAVPIYHSDILETISEDIGLMAREPELGPASGSNFDGEATTINISAAVLYELGSEIAWDRVQQRQDEADDDDE